MIMSSNPFKAALLAGRGLTGIRTSLCSPAIVELLSDCGFDYIYIDTEHTPGDVKIVQAQLWAMRGSPSMHLVRPPENNETVIKKFLDVGVQNFLIPMIQSPEDAHRAVAATRYPPLGRRGVCGRSGANRYGRLKDYYLQANEQVCVVAMIETRTALDRLEEIAAVEGVDAVWVGPGDLAADFGLLGAGGASHPQVRAAIDDAISRARQIGKPIGVPSSNEDIARHLVASGCALVTASSDVDILAENGDRLAKLLKG